MRRIVTYGRRESLPPRSAAVTAAGSPPGQPPGQPAGQPPDQPAGQPPDQPAGQPAGRPAVQPPPVRLGTLQTGGLAPAILGVVDRGVRLRPAAAGALRIEIELAPLEDYPPVTIRFGDREVVVEDGAAEQPDARIRGALADLIALMVSPAVGGVPLPVNARGRAALGMVVSRRVRIDGSLACVRRVLAVIRV